ncbi:hypothetical protein V2J09_013695 [Rumex salicifolius]
MALTLDSTRSLIVQCRHQENPRELYRIEGISTLVDVGGGIGSSLNMIISSYPSIKGVNFDLPHVVHNAPAYPGVEHVGGDMFSSRWLRRPTTRGGTNVFHCDAMMLTLNPGGKERTEAEFEYLAKVSGLHAFKLACSAYDYKDIKFIK